MAAIKIRELPEEDRPREKLLKHGADGLTNRELIAILLRTGVPGKNAVEVGGEILEKVQKPERPFANFRPRIEEHPWCWPRQSGAAGRGIQAR